MILYIISYIEIHKEPLKIFELINKFSNVAGYRINIQEIVFLYTDEEQFKNKI